MKRLLSLALPLIIITASGAGAYWLIMTAPRATPKAPEEKIWPLAVTKGEVVTITPRIEVFGEIFGLFRHKFEEMPSLVNKIAKRIVEVETKDESKTEGRINQLYLSIFCKHFEYKNIEKIISTLQTDTRIQQAIGNAIPNSSSFEKPYLNRAIHSR